MLHCLQFGRVKFALAFLFGLTPALAFGSGFITTPDECYMVKSVDKTAKAVHLSAIGKCQGRAGRAFVDLDGEVTVFRAEGEGQKQVVQPMSMPDIAGTLAKAKDMAKSMQLPKNAYEEQMRAKASETIAFYNSPEFQAKLNSEKARIKREMFHEQLKDLSVTEGGLKAVKEVAKREDSKRKSLQDDERIYIFVSSSMPLATVRNYAASAARFNDPKKVVLVMRGFIGGMQKIGPTMSYIADVLNASPATCNLASGEQCQTLNSNVMIDPILFRRYRINKVPATVFAKGVQVKIADQSEGNDDVTVGSFSVAYGDASLEYNLKKISEVMPEARGLTGF